MSRTDRLKENSSVMPFAVVDNGMASLLRQSLEIAKHIKFFNANNHPEGHFDQLLLTIAELWELYRKDKAYHPDKNMEPSQALLFTFIENLHTTGRHFNESWHQFTSWYLNEFLNVNPLPIAGDKVWLEFRKNVPENVLIKEGFGFAVKDSNNEPVFYRLTEDLTVNDIEIDGIYSLFFEKDRNREPAAKLNFVTSVKIHDLLASPGRDGQMMFSKNQDAHLSKALGIVISSPALLLREGKRSVRITLTSENQKWSQHLDKIVQSLKKHYTELFEKSKDEHRWLLEVTAKYKELAIHHPKLGDHYRRLEAAFRWKAEECDRLFRQYDHKSKDGNEELLFRDVFNNILYLSISTTEGWRQIPECLVRKINDNTLLLAFTLPEDFPATTGGNKIQHTYTSDNPALSILLNFDAWLYAYSWMKDFLLSKVTINTAVEGIGNLQVYNELGRVDNSKPFVPFGINTARGSWMAIGNYEMSIRHTKSIGLRIRWNQLPSDPRGLAGHYSGYDNGTTNRSFTVKTNYLTDYKWYDTAGKNTYYLFATTPETPGGEPYPESKLARRSTFDDIQMKGMSPVRVSEDEYEYTINARSGFVRLTLDKPVSGFGEELYRRIFTEQMMANARKKKKYPTINPPIAPVIEKITLSYESEDVIDLRNPHHADGSAVYQVSPLGYITAARAQKQSIPLAFSLDKDANLLISLKNVKGGETFCMYLDFSVISNEYFKDQLPSIRMYWGNGTSWEEIPQGSVIKDETDRMLVSGCMTLRFPENMSASLFDAEGLLWIRAAIEKNEQHIPQLAAIYTNVGKVVLEIDELDGDKWKYFKTLNGELSPEKNLPGIASFKRITNFYAGRERESTRDMQMRVSEYVTHRGRAVTPRDYERIALQEFGDLGRVKFLPGFQSSSQAGKSVTLAVIPMPQPGDKNYCKPVVTSGFLAKVERYLEKRTTAYVTEVNVINPVYEELIVKCIANVKKEYHLAMFGTILKDLLDELIAPWQKKREIPSFGQEISVSEVFNKLHALDFIADIEHLSIIRVSETKDPSDYDEWFELGEFRNREKDIIRPRFPHSIFVPSAEHIIELNLPHDHSTMDTFGLGEMKVGRTFIIGK